MTHNQLGQALKILNHRDYSISISLYNEEIANVTHLWKILDHDTLDWRHGLNEKLDFLDDEDTWFDHKMTIEIIGIYINVRIEKH